MYTVRDILRSKGMDIWSISPQATAYEALQIMSDKDVGALLITDHEKVAGIYITLPGLYFP